MKLAQINLTRGFYIPGIGETVKLVNVEAEETPTGYLVTTPTAKVIVPWGCVAPSVVEFVPLTVAKLPPEAVEAAKKQPPGEVRLVGLAEIATGAQAHGTGIFAGMDRGQGERTTHRCTGCEWFIDTTMMTEEAVTAAVHAHLKAEHTPAVPAPIPQPPPPQKRGGRK